MTTFGRIMKMEERIVLDGSVIPLDGGEVGGAEGELAEAAAVDAGAALADGASLEQQNAENEADESAENLEESGGIESPELRGLLINSNVDQHEVMADALLKDVLVYVYDGSTDSLDEILVGFKDAAGGKAFDSIALATHSQGAGTFALGSGEHVSLGNFLGNSEQQEFFAGLGGMIDVDGHLDLLTCNLAGTQDGDLLLASIEDAAGVDIAASDDLTGNAAYGGDWVLERGDVDVVSLYFDAGEIENYGSTLLAETKFSSAPAGSESGRSVAIDGDYAIVGARLEETSGVKHGAAYIYYYDGSAWQQQARLTASDGAHLDYFGSSVAISGTTAIVGAYGDGDMGLGSGSVYVFDFDDGDWINDQVKLTASDGANGDSFGSSVGISGNTLIVGAYGDDDSGSNSGSAYIFDFDDGDWGNDQVKLTASDGALDDRFGCSVAISGTHAIVGALRDDDNGSNSGSAYIFDFDDGDWNDDQFKITASDGAADDEFGGAVAISGNIAIVGAYADDDNGSNSGSAYIYDFDDGSWTNDQTKLTASDGATGDFFGYSVAASGDAVIVGAYKNSSFGSAYIFDYSDGCWTDNVVKLAASDGAVSDYFGYSVAISSKTAIVGAYQDNDNGSYSGSAYLFSDFYDPSVENPIADQIATEGVAFSFQFAADSFADGDSDISYTATLADGAALPYWLSFDASTRTFSGTPADSDVSVVEVKVTANDPDASVSDTFRITVFPEPDTITTPDIKLTPATIASSFAGASVAIDGDYAIIGAPSAYSGGVKTGVAYIYYYDGTSWVLEDTLTANDGATGEAFGSSVAISGNTAVVGAQFDDDNGSLSGSAYVFNFDDGDWGNDQVKLTADDGATSDVFGGSVAISGTNIIVGAYGNDDDGNESGSAYLFDYDDGDWSNDQVKFTASDGAMDDKFGVSVAISGTNIIVGAKGDDGLGSTSGKAYVFSLVAGSWSEQAKLAPSDGFNGDAFGNSVAIYDDTIVIGAYLHNSAYVFEYASGSWTQQAKLVAPDSISYGAFGSSVDIDESVIIVGATSNNSAYLFDLDDGSWTNDVVRVTSSITNSFGGSVGVSGKVVIAGASNDDDIASNAGSAYIFSDFYDPIVENPIPNQHATEGAPFSFQFTADTFDDGDNDITYTATLDDGSALPAWLAFNASTRTFSGIPDSGAGEYIDVKVIASDADSSVSDTFRINITQAGDASAGDDPVAYIPPNDIAVTLPPAVGFDSNTEGNNDGSGMGEGILPPVGGIIGGGEGRMEVPLPEGEGNPADTEGAEDGDVDGKKDGADKGKTDKDVDGKDNSGKGEDSSGKDNQSQDDTPEENQSDNITIHFEISDGAGTSVDLMIQSPFAERISPSQVGALFSNSLQVFASLPFDVGSQMAEMTQDAIGNTMTTAALVNQAEPLLASARTFLVMLENSEMDFAMQGSGMTAVTQSLDLIIEDAIAELVTARGNSLVMNDLLRILSLNISTFEDRLPDDSFVGSIERLAECNQKFAYSYEVLNELLKEAQYHQDMGESMTPDELEGLLELIRARARESSLGISDKADKASRDVLTFLTRSLQQKDINRGDLQAQVDTIFRQWYDNLGMSAPVSPQNVSISTAESR